MVWEIFIGVVLILLMLDLFVFNKTAHVISHKEAAGWTAFWVGLSLAFSGVIYWLYGGGHVDNPLNYTPQTAFTKYISGYLVELSLSVDNIFVIAIIFKSLSIPQKFQHRVLFWGIIGAIVFRAIMIFFGIWLIEKVEWVTIIFGIFLIYTAWTMVFKKKDEGFDPDKSKMLKALRRFLPVTKHLHGQKLMLRRGNILFATPLLLALVLIEFTDLLFALDSIPAVLAITEDAFLVFTSNILAVLGLRSMYFFLANIMDKFAYLHFSLAFILVFVGLKMLFHSYMQTHQIDVPEWLSLLIIFGALSVGMLLSHHKNLSSKSEV